jgi:hypothetical protein
MLGAESGAIASSVNVDSVTEHLHAVGMNATVHQVRPLVVGECDHTISTTVEPQVEVTVAPGVDVHVRRYHERNVQLRGDLCSGEAQ